MVKHRSSLNNYSPSKQFLWYQALDFHIRTTHRMSLIVVTLNLNDFSSVISGRVLTSVRKKKSKWNDITLNILIEDARSWEMGKAINKYFTLKFFTLNFLLYMLLCIQGNHYISIQKRANNRKGGWKLHSWKRRYYSLIILSVLFGMILLLINIFSRNKETRMISTQLLDFKRVNLHSSHQNWN